jgi:type VI secretion system secreted protein VgrG
MVLKQANRHIRINTNLGEDKIFLETFSGEERVSDLFRFELGLLTDDPSFSMDSLLNQPAVVSLTQHDDTDRHFHGIINHIEEIETRTEGYTVYRATMVPWAWLLTLFNDCRIFQNKTVPDIVQQVFGDRGFTDYANRVTGTYTPREYTVQYRETDFNFISRLLEDEGIFYFFEHDQNKHTLVMADQPSAFVDCPGQSSAAYDTTPGLWQDLDVILSVRRTKELRVGKITENDYDFTKPKVAIDADLTSDRKGEFYEYPGKYIIRSEGSRYARIRLEEQEVRILTLTAETNCRAFRAGFQFAMTGYFRDEANQAYHILVMYHRAANNIHISNMEMPESFDYRNTLEAIPASTPYHPPRHARRPFIQGSQTAVVVGKSGEEIWVDQYGRVKVQFFWDRAGKMDENSSCWIRVAQLWAGKGWGAVFTPRIGQEVIVDFLEGDPDRPIITGRVYNGDQTVPYALPGEQTKSTIKSMSSKGGGGFNEIRLEDKAGSEQVFIFGQKDEDIRITHDAREWIGNDRSLIVIRDQMEKTGRDKHDHVTRDHIEKIDRDHHLDIEGKEAIKIVGSHSMQVTGDVIEAFQGNQSTQVTQNIYIKGMQVVIEAMTGLTIKQGPNFITMDPSGISIVGTPLVMINSGGSALSGSAGSPVSPLSPTDPAEADTANPGELASTSARPGALATASATNVAAIMGTTSPASNAPTHNPNAPENQDKKHWIEIQLYDDDGNPVPGEPYKVTLPDGTTVADGTLDDKGFARVDNIDPGTCQVTFPNLDKDSWDPK